MKISYWIKISFSIIVSVAICAVGYFNNLMTISDCILFFSAMIVAVGWFITGHLDRKNEIAKELRTYRLDMLHSFLPVLRYFQDFDNNPVPLTERTKELARLLGATRSKFLMYGYDDEIKAYETLVGEFESPERKNEKLIHCVNALATIVRNRIRKELDLPSQKLERKS